jgi:hypothetical protein
MELFFKRHHRKLGWTLVVLELLSVANGMVFFLGMAKFSIVSWLMFNACAPSILLFIAGFIARKDFVMASSVPFLLFFGGGGLFMFGWSGTMIFAQVSHILMVLSVVYLVFVAAADNRLRTSARGFIAGMILFAILVPVQQKYVARHPDLVKMMGDPVFEKKMNIR